MNQSDAQDSHKGCQKAVDDLKADLTAEIERLQEAWETADSVAQMVAHDRDEALENFAQVEQEVERFTDLLAQIHAIAKEDPQGNDAREAIDTIERLSRRG